ncbi:hypothetical protein G6F56_004879 [Rhizopus delemar]|nr:hypothetical protein G6F56_004879 [Rhizopus delemar]
MYVRPQPTNQWGPFKRHTSQKITPLVRFYEKSGEKEELKIEPVLVRPVLDSSSEPVLDPSSESVLDSLSEPVLDPSSESVLDPLSESNESMRAYFTDDDDEEKIEEETVTKSQTCPNLSVCNSPLPTKQQRAKERMNHAFSKGQMRLKRTTTWINLPVQKLLASPPVHNLGVLLSKKYHSAAENVLRLQNNLQHHLSQLHSKETVSCSKSTLKVQTDGYPTLQPTGTMNKKIFPVPKKIMHCRVMQIINTSSERDCEYEISVYHNGTELVTQKGHLCKIDKNMSADRPQEDAMQLEIQEPFDLTFKVAARYTNTRFRHGLAKMGLWPTAQKPNKLVGHAILHFDSKQDHQGINRFKLIKMNERVFHAFNLELVVDIKMVNGLPAAVKKFPWAYRHSALFTSESLKNSDIIRDPDQVLLSQKHCMEGDYLTIYTRGSAHPAWKRYWVMMEKDQLVLYDFTYKTSKGPVNTISLLPLLSVSKPSMDDCENAGIARKIGIMLQFDRHKAVLGKDVRFDDGEVLEGKAFVYCDDETKVNHWRRALVAYTTKESTHRKETEGDIDLRFLW